MAAPTARPPPDLRHLGYLAGSARPGPDAARAADRARAGQPRRGVRPRRGRADRPAVPAGRAPVAGRTAGPSRAGRGGTGVGAARHGLVYGPVPAAATGPRGGRRNRRMSSGRGTSAMADTVA